MKAIRYHRYGGPEVLEFEDVDMPAVGDDDVLVRVRAAALNPLDLHFLQGLPYVGRGTMGLTRPKVDGLGVDFAGQVEAVGRNVTGFRAGDEVFGSGQRTFAEYTTLGRNAVLLPKPADLTPEQAAAVPAAGFTALQALRDKGRVRSGYAVLVNGAAGGVGTFTVQIAKALGAQTTGVCGTGNVDLVRSIGADHVVDYTREDFTRAGRRYDVVVDMVGNHSVGELRRVLDRKGVLVGVGGPDKGRWLGPAITFVKMVAAGPFVSQSMAPMLARPNRGDLAVLRDLIGSGKVTPVIDRTYPLGEVPEALRYLRTGHAKGKVVVTV
jgi:NADPH:quinone reductase-like Zn-dependent oxidoreductase